LYQKEKGVLDPGGKNLLEGGRKESEIAHFDPDNFDMSNSTLL
jgi:hypothetical protein